MGSSIRLQENLGGAPEESGLKKVWSDSETGTVPFSGGFPGATTMIFADGAPLLGEAFTSGIHYFYSSHKHAKYKHLTFGPAIGYNRFVSQGIFLIQSILQQMRNTVDFSA
jgi:hypothetical protein